MVGTWQPYCEMRSKTSHTCDEGIACEKAHLSTDFPLLDIHPRRVFFGRGIRIILDRILFDNIHATSLQAKEELEGHEQVLEEAIRRETSLLPPAPKVVSVVWVIP